MRSTRWDVRALWQAAALAAVLFGVGCLVTAATDEGGVSWGARLGRTLPLLPACGAMATFLSLRRAARRGELLALETLGCPPARAALPAVVGGASGSLLALVLLLGLPAARCQGTVAAFFPRVGGSAVKVEPGPAFIDVVHHARITPDGIVSAGPPASTGGEGLPRGARVAVALVVAAVGAGLPLLAARRARDRSNAPLLVAASLCVSSLVLFHFAAAGLASAFLPCVPALALLIAAALRYGRAPWA